MARIAYSSNGNTPFERLLGHNKEILDSWNQLEITFFTKATLPQNLLEEVRRNLAFSNQCEYCMAKGKPEGIEDSRILMAVAFAKSFVDDHLAINEEQFDLLKSEFTESEISELCSFICFISASQKFGAMLNLRPGE